MPACCSAVRAEISIHALRKEGDDRAVVRDHECRGFLSTPSARRATQKGHTERRRQAISIHALREEGDHRDHHGRLGQQDFYPRPPRGGRRKHRRAGHLKQNFYPRPPRGGRPGQYGSIERHHHISIHALREEGDWDGNNFILTFFQFLSTPSAKRATNFLRVGGRFTGDFYLRPPRRGRRSRLPRARHLQAISIHALREEGDRCTQTTDYIFADFYPRPPRGGRPPTVSLDHRLEAISIHALREEGDGQRCRGQPQRCGISIHALREEGDVASVLLIVTGCYFYPRPPRGGRPSSRQQ